MKKINFKQFIQVVYDVCSGTLSGLESVEEKIKLVMQVVGLVMLKDELEIEEPTGARNLGEKLLAADVISRLKGMDD